MIAFVDVQECAGHEGQALVGSLLGDADKHEPGEETVEKVAKQAWLIVSWRVSPARAHQHVEWADFKERDEMNAFERGVRRLPTLARG